MLGKTEIVVEYTHVCEVKINRCFDLVTPSVVLNNKKLNYFHRIINTNIILHCTVWFEHVLTHIHKLIEQYLHMTTTPIHILISETGHKYTACQPI